MRKGWKSLLILTMVVLYGSIHALAAIPTVNVQTMIEENKRAAELALERGNFYHAIRILQLNQQLSPQNFQHVRSEARAYMTWAEKTRSLHGPEKAKPYFLDAVAVFDRAVEVARKNKVDENLIRDMINEKIIALIRAEEYSKARDILKEFLDQDGRDVLANYLMGLAIRFEYIDRAESGENPPAEWVFQSNRYFERAIEYAKYELIPYAYFFAGFAYYELGQTEIAKRYFEKWQEQFKMMKDAQGLSYEDYDEREKMYWDSVNGILSRLR